MQATAETKRAAYEAGYAFYKASDRQVSTLRNTPAPYHIPAEAWSWVRGIEAAQADDRAGQLD